MQGQPHHQGPEVNSAPSSMEPRNEPAHRLDLYSKQGMPLELCPSLIYQTIYHSAIALHSTQLVSSNMAMAPHRVAIQLNNTSHASCIGSTLSSLQAVR